MHFVVGHPRSGTHLLSDLLNAGGAKVAMHEAFVELSPGESFIALATDYYEGRVGADAVRAAVSGYPVPPAIRIDANWKNAWILPVLLELYPEARVLHLTRDPKSNVIACHNLGYYGPGDLHADAPGFHRWLRAMPSVHRPDWDALSMFGRNCAFWAESHRLILEQRRALAGRYLQLRLEDIHDLAGIAGIYEFFRLPLPTEKASEAVRILARPSNTQARVKERVQEHQGEALLPVFEECPAQVQAELRRICGPIAAAVGYRL